MDAFMESARRMSREELLEEKHLLDKMLKIDFCPDDADFIDELTHKINVVIYLLLNSK